MLNKGSSAERGMFEELEGRVLLAANPLVQGTFDDDLLAVVLAPASVTVTMNGASQVFSTSNLGTLTIDGLGGNDMLTLTTAGQASRIVLRPTSSNIQGNGYVVNIANVYLQRVQGDSAATASFYDSPGDDRWVACPDYSYMAGPGYYNYANSCTGYYAHANAGGNDTAVLYDSPTDDEFSSTPDSASISSSGYVASASGFESVYAYSSAGGKDTATMYDSGGNDRFSANSKYAFFAGAAFYNYVSGFEEVRAYATGPNDAAWLYDSPGDDSLSVNSAYGYMSGDGFYNYASGFAKVYGYSTAGGNDVARLYGSSGDDIYSATPAYGYLSGYSDGKSWCNYATGFKQLYGLAGTGGNDIACLYDSPGNDTFYATPTYGYLAGTEYYNSAIGFGKLYAYSKSGGRDIAKLYDSAGDDLFSASPAYGYMSGTGFYNYASGFEQLQAYATAGGTDKAVLYGSSGDDTFIATSKWAQMVGGGYYLFTSGFTNTYANAKGGNDVAFLYDMAAQSGFASTGTYSYVREAGHTQYAIGFDDVRDLHIRPYDLTTDILGPDNMNNPLWIRHNGITRAMWVIADQVIAAAGAVTDHQKIVALMNFVGIAREGNLSEFTWDYVAVASPEDLLLGAVGQCGSWSTVLVALATAMDIPARLVGLYNYPVNNGHVVTEEQINGKWQVYDPSFASYYTTDPSNTTDPVCLSFDQLHAGQGSQPGAMVVVNNRLHLDGRPEATDFLGPAIYEKADPAGPIGPQWPMLFPLSLDLAAKPVLDKSMFGASNLGADYIGGALVNFEQRFTLSGLTAGKTYTLTVAYDGWTGDRNGQSSFTTYAQVASGGTLVSGAAYNYSLTGSTAPWVIRFTAASPTTTVLLTHMYNWILVLYAQSYTLAEA